MRPTPPQAIAFLKQHEGLKLVAKPDIGGTMDAGYGHVEPSLKDGQKITQRQADLWLLADAQKAAASVCAILNEPVLLDLTDNQYSALISFVFNLGPNPKATLWKLINARDHDHVPAEFMRWVYCKGKKVQGLVNRRAAEVALWSTAEPGSVPDEPSSAVTREADTPPLPAKPFSVGHAATVAVAAAGGVAEGAKRVTEIVQPYADKSDIVQHVLSYAATAGAGAAVVVAFLLWLQSRRAKH